MNGGLISGNGSGVGARGGVLGISNVTNSNNDGPGILARNASSLLLRYAHIEGNHGDGIWLGDVSFLEVSGDPPTQVQGNLGWGLYCSPPPSVAQYFSYGSALVVAENNAGDISCTMATN